MKNLSGVLHRLLILVLICLGPLSYATHIVGIDLFYTYVSGNTYKITLVAYGDCAGTAFSTLPTADPTICIYDGATSVGSLNLSIQAPIDGVEITPVCPADAGLTQCTSLTYTIPGIKKFIYTGEYTLPYTSATWRFIFTGNMGSSSAGRGTTITNITSGTIVQLEDTLNNTLSYNDNALLTVLPTPFFCLDQANTYNPGASDPDGDSLAFYLVSGMNGNGNCTSIGGAISYIFPYTPTAPLGTTSFAFNSRTGEIDFNPNILQRALVVYNVEEFRHPGMYMIGTCQREMTFTVLTCTDLPPTGGFNTATSGTITDPTDFKICANAGAFSIHINPTESDTFNTITVTASGLPTGATFTTLSNGTNHPACTFSWNTTGVTTGTYTFYVTFEDNACPLAGIQTLAYTITVLPVPTVVTGPGSIVCPGVGTTLTASGAISYTWSPGTGLSCIPCGTTTATPASTTTYTVTGTAANGCSNTDTVTVTVKPAPPIVAGTATSICTGTSATLSAAGGISYTWAPGSTLSCTTCTNPTADPTVTTVYTLTGVGANGCSATSTVTIGVNPLPVISVAPASMCEGSSVVLSPSGGVSYTWSPGATLSCTACTNPVASPTVTTTYIVTGTDVNGCVNTGTVTVTVGAVPLPPTVISPVSYCQNATAAALTATGTALLWYTVPTGGVGSAIAPVPVTSTVGTTIYYVSQTVSGCESARSPISVIIKPLPAISVVPPAPQICIGQTVALTASGGTSYAWTPPTGLSATTGAAVNASPTVTTIYSVSGLGVNGCTGVNTITVIVNPLPVIVISPISATICNGSSAVLNASGAVDYSWSPAATLSSSTGATVTASPSVTVTYVITGTDANACVNTASVTVTVNPIPPAPAVVSPVVYCVNATATALTATGTSLLWYTTSTGGTGTTTAPIPSTTTAGATMWYVSQTVAGCESPRDSIQVIVKPLPVITISPTAAAICDGKDTTLTASGGVTYSWLPVAGLGTTTGMTVVAHPVTTTVYTVTGTGVNGCTNTATLLVTVNPLPVILITPAAPTICNGSSTSMAASGAISYTWLPASTLSSSTGTTVTADPVTTTTYTITAIDANNCVNNTTAVVTVNPIPPAPGVITPLKYCQNTTPPALTATGSSLLWYATATGGVGSATAPVPSTAVVGTTTYYVSQTVGGCESPRASIQVIILPLPVVTCAPPAAAICAGQSVALVTSGAITYNWLPVAGLTVTTGVAITATPPVTTTYTVTGTDANHCSNTAISVITVHPLPVITILPATPAICIGSDITLTAGGASAYTWSPASTLSNTTGNSVVATPTNTTNYTITGIDGFGCVNSTVVTVVVNPIPPPPAVVSPLVFCQFAPGTALTATGSNLLWYTSSAGGTGSTTAPVPPTSALGSSEWYVSQTVNNCESPRDSIKVEIIQNAIADFNFVIKPGCIRDTIVFTNTSTFASHYLWNFGDNTTDTATSPSHTYPAVQGVTDINITLYSYSAICYEDSVTKTGTLTPMPHLKLTNVTPDQTLVYGDTLTLNADGAQTYLWSPDNGTLSDVNINDPRAYPFESTTYTVLGMDYNGCVDSANVYITVVYEDNPIIPSAFTPNNDGKNDVFGILNLKYSKLETFRIYNRWGQEVFSTNDVDKGWDGTFNGVPQGLGVFDYLIVIVHPDGSKRIFKGDVTLIR